MSSLTPSSEATKPESDRIIFDSKPINRFKSATFEESIDSLASNENPQAFNSGKSVGSKKPLLS